MRRGLKKAFTLVEILIVVVILGILAAIVIPQFTSASEDAQLSNVQTQLSTIRSQIELFRVRNNGTYPAFPIAGANGFGWGDPEGATEAAQGMLSDDFLRNPPVNPRTGTADVVLGAEPVAAPAGANPPGWFWDAAENEIYANGYDEANQAWF